MGCSPSEHEDKCLDFFVEVSITEGVEALNWISQHEILRKPLLLLRMVTLD